MSEFELHDSGQRTEFGTGSLRDTDAGKSRPDFLSPYALDRFGHHMAKGAAKYEEFNWELGQNVTRFVASMEHHLNAYKRGLRDEDHLAALMYGVQAIIHFEELSKLGDATALAMLDCYASKHLADEIRSEVGAMLEAESYMRTFEGEDDQRRVVGALSVYHVPTERDVLTLKPEPDLTGCTVRVVRDVTKEEYFDGITAGGFHLYSGQILEVLALKDDGLYICQGTKFSSYFFGAVEETDWEFDHVKPEWVEAI